ncbi:MAG TPA: UDP-3-O-(3-hydroxymyristoyl)glucosamine N-acyltransferase [Micropepsaceae bacterium]|nr:UDP-3-O-(3-hydroxymyristoyl)glucosamine N-acyltransferase [Micropepsaceae bacterium]
MADPRFYDNRGPFRLSEICRAAQIEADSANQDDSVHDVAALDCAGLLHLTFREQRKAPGPRPTNAGWCIIGLGEGAPETSRTVLLRAKSAQSSFAAVAQMFYPECESAFSAQDVPVHPSAKIGAGVILSPGVVIGAHAEIGDGTRIGPNATVGRGVAIGRGCEIGAQTVLGFAYVGDEVVIQPGAVIGASGFGFSAGPRGHVKIPQLGRVILQDRVDIGANSTIDRAALGDTVIGEGTKIDNLVQIGHNARVGRHCLIAGQAGLSGSVTLGDFVVMGGKAAVADHLTVGDRARLAGFAGVAHDLEGGRDYGGVPARPIREWHRQTAYLSRITRGDMKRR